MIMTESTWMRFEKEGEELYEYMTTHFNDMFEPTGSIKYFDMHYTTYLTSGYYDRVKKECGKKVHKEILPWIREEQRSGRLFNKDNWKPFRDQLTFTRMYYGYRMLFLFHDFFYFQVTIARICHDTTNSELKSTIDLQVALYGWKEKGMEYVQPDNQVIVDADRMMPEKHWKRK